LINKNFPATLIILNDTRFARTSSSSEDIGMAFGGAVDGWVGDWLDVLRRCWRI